jgi:hypothetical protein
MATTIRSRFVALDLAEGWIDMPRRGGWTLKHPERSGELTISMFPVAEGVTMDLPTLEALSRERSRNTDPLSRSEVPLDETAWSQGSLFCLATSARRGPFPSSDRGRTTYTRHWTVSDGAYVIEATLHEYDEDAFRVGGQDGDDMMRSVRFEGPS